MLLVIGKSGFEYVKDASYKNHLKSSQVLTRNFATLSDLLSFHFSLFTFIFLLLSFIFYLFTFIFSIKNCRFDKPKSNFLNAKSISGFILKADWFSPALLLMIVLAKFFPTPGLVEGVFSLKSFAGYGISVIFFLYGLRLSLSQMLSCVNNWRLHLLVQATTFIVFPLIVLMFRGLFSDTLYYSLWLGVFYLAALPSTVSSAVVMVSLAGGNVTGAIFNATFSKIGRAHV